MSEYQMTPGALRALRSAEELARAHGAEEIEPGHLLWALGLEESRAAEILLEHRISVAQMSARFSPDRPASAPDLSGSPDTDPGGQQPSIRNNATLETVILEARRQAILLGRHSELGTEQLLFGLALVESPASDLLKNHGILPDAILSWIKDEPQQAETPLEVDFSIVWRDRTAQDHTNTLRIMDAAANRAREGLRVVEDFTRFSLDDAHLTRLLKECRHALSDALRSSSLAGMLPARDTERDVGTVLSTPAEVQRTSPMDVVTANLKRVQEAVRTLEEYGKLISPDLAEPFGQLRYRLYTIEKAVLTTHANIARLQDCTLCLLATESLCHHGSGPAIRESLAAGAGMIQVREKGMTHRDLMAHARRVREWTRAVGALLIVNDRPDVAVLCDADGVHVGQDDLSVREARQIVGPDRMVGVSTHSIEQARRAVIDGADYLGVGPVFPSATKAFEDLAGLDFVRLAAEEIKLPWFAIGGINQENVHDVVAAGATRIAVSGTICSAEDPKAACRRLLDAMQQPSV